MDKGQWDRWCKEEVTVKIPKIGLLSLVGNLQLALRHPDNNGPTSKIVRQLGKQFAAMIKDDGVIQPEVLAEWRKEGLI